MRYCENDTVSVYEEVDGNLARLLRKTANEVEKHNNDYQNLNIDYDCESAEYRATLYVHD